MKLSRVSSLVVQYTGLLLVAVGVFLYLGGVFQVGKDFRVIVFILTLAAMFVGGALALLGMYRGDVAQSKQKVVEFLKGMSAPAVGIVLSLLIGAIVMLIAGYNPIQGVWGDVLRRVCQKLVNNRPECGAAYLYWFGGCVCVPGRAAEHWRRRAVLHRCDGCCGTWYLF